MYRWWKKPTFQEKFVFTLIEGLREINVVVWNSNTVNSDDLIGSGKVQQQKVLSQGFDDTAWPLQTKKEASNKPCSIRPSIGNTNSWIISIFSSSTTCSFSPNTFWLSSTISLFHSPASFSILSSFSLSHSPTPSSSISSSISLSPSIGCLSFTLLIICISASALSTTGLLLSSRSIPWSLSSTITLMLCS